MASKQSLKESGKYAKSSVGKTSVRENVSTKEQSSLKEQLRVSKDNIEFLKNEHAKMLQALHDEIEKLQCKCRG